MQCAKCSAEFIEDASLYTDTPPHIRLSCPACGAFIKYVRKPMEGEPADKLVTFGKYNGHTLGQILEADRGYVEYLARSTGSLASAARILLQ